MALTATQADNFDDNTKNTSIWEDPTTIPIFANEYSPLGGTISESGSQLNLTGAVSTGGAVQGYTSVDTALDMRGSEIVLQLVTVPTAGGQGISLIFGASETGHVYRWQISNNFGTVTIEAKSNNFGTAGTPFSATYSATDHAWLRIRQDSAAGGTVYWDTAPDSSGSPGTWVNRRSVASADGAYWDPATCQVGVVVAMDSSNASPFTFVVDNFNTTAGGGGIDLDPITSCYPIGSI